jgi:hypothetical protein
LSTAIWILIGWGALSLAFLTGYVYGAAVGRRQGFEAGWRACADARPSSGPRLRPGSKRVTS